MALYRVAIVGCGRMACTIDDEVERLLGNDSLVLPYCHAGGYAAVPDTEMVAACDVDAERLRRAQDRWKIPRGYSDYRECILTEKPEIISVTTRPENHAEIIVFAAEHGVKGMYVEKPLCCSLAETDQIRDALTQNGVQLEFGPMRRNWAVFQQARALASSGELGELTSALGFHGNPCGGHFLDTLLYLLGDPEAVAVQATLGKLSPLDGDTSGSRFKPDASIVVGRVALANGTTLFACQTGVRSEYEIACSAGVIRIASDGHHLVVRRYLNQSNSYEDVPVPAVTHWSGTTHKVRDLVASIQTGQPGVSNLRATLISQEIGYAMYESHLRGGVEVAVPIADRTRWVSSW